MVQENSQIHSIIHKCYHSNIIKEGEYILKSGDLSKYYFDFKNLVAHPALLKEIGDYLYNQIKLSKVKFTHIAAIAIGGIPIACYISTKYDIPMVMVRGEKKEYGTGKQIEGDYKKGVKTILIDDVMTSGGSLMDTMSQLGGKMDVVGIYVIMDRQVVTPKLEIDNKLYTVNSVLNKTDIVRYRLSQIMIKKKSKICLSLDLQNQDHFFGVLDKIGNKIVTVKIHSDITVGDFSEFREKLIKYSIEQEFLIMEDRKFVDISYISSKQYGQYKNWVDMVTVMGNINSEVIWGMSGVVIVNDMSNNDFDWTPRVHTLLENIDLCKHVIGIVSQSRFPNINMYTMTPGINKQVKNINDQKYRTIDTVDADLYIIGRGLYNGDPLVNISGFLKQ
tara:strand:- start:1605 stop:2774 length:1170 start_codon:yes stop_codon:yes gene_type:complete